VFLQWNANHRYWPLSIGNSTEWSFLIFGVALFGSQPDCAEMVNGVLSLLYTRVRPRKKSPMGNAEHCQIQAQECRRLLALPQSEAAAQVLRNLCQSWVRIATQLDLYAEIVRKEAAQKKKAAQK
jgi:hypothetical protein